MYTYLYELAAGKIQETVGYDGGGGGGGQRAKKWMVEAHSCISRLCNFFWIYSEIVFLINPIIIHKTICNL